MGWKVVLFAIAGVALAIAAWPRERASVTRRALVEQVVGRPAMSTVTARADEPVHIPAWLAGSGRKRRVAGHVMADRRPIVGARVRLASRASESRAHRPSR